METRQPKKQRWWMLGITLALIVFVGGGLLIGANAIKSNTESTLLCPLRTKPECIKDMPKPICPSIPNFNTTCPLDAAE